MSDAAGGAGAGAGGSSPPSQARFPPPFPGAAGWGGEVAEDPSILFPGANFLPPSPSDASNPAGLQQGTAVEAPSSSPALPSPPLAAVLADLGGSSGVETPPIFETWVRNPPPPPHPSRPRRISLLAVGVAVCPVPRCALWDEGADTSAAALNHLSCAHTAADVPPAALSARRLIPCPHCDRPFVAWRKARGPRPLAAHIGRCQVKRQRQRALAATAVAATWSPPSPPPRTAPTAPTPRPPPPPPAPLPGAAVTPTMDLFADDPGAWRRELTAFLAGVAPTDADRPALLASWARTSAHVPAVCLEAWQRLEQDALPWVLSQPSNSQAWLWHGLLPSLALHVPATGRGARPGHRPLTRADHMAALLAGDFGAVLADRNA